MLVAALHQLPARGEDKRAMREFLRKLDDVTGVVVIACMVLTVLSVILQFVTKATVNIFNITYYVCLSLMVLLMLIKHIVNFKRNIYESTAFLIVNIIALIVVIVTVIGLKMNAFQNNAGGVILHYISLLAFMATSLLLL